MMLTAQRIDLTTAAQAASAMDMASNCLLSAASAVASQQLLFPLAQPLGEAQNLSVVLSSTGAPGRRKSSKKLDEHAAPVAGR